MSQHATLNVRYQRLKLNVNCSRTIILMKSPSLEWRMMYGANPFVWSESFLIRISISMQFGTGPEIDLPLINCRPGWSEWMPFREMQWEKLTKKHSNKIWSNRIINLHDTKQISSTVFQFLNSLTILSFTFSNKLNYQNLTDKRF